MRLSEAILLGDSLKKPDPGVWLLEDGSCGCAFGGALLAAGVNPLRFVLQLGGVLNICETPIVKALWPWITRYVLHKISSGYFRVAAGQMTIEELADYVRSIEPDEQPKTVHEIVDDVMKRREESEDDEVDADGFGDCADAVRQG